MENEVYNPEIHCCNRWYKDFCGCVKTALQSYKQDSKDKNINSTLKFLADNNINFFESKIKNIVVINTSSKKINLSLIKEKNLLKCRFEGNSKWYLYSKKKFLEHFSQPILCPLCEKSIDKCKCTNEDFFGPENELMK